MNWLAGLLLDHNSARLQLATADQIAYPKLDHIAAAQLAVDRQIQQRPVPNSVFMVEEEAHRPDLLLLERLLRPH